MRSESVRRFFKTRLAALSAAQVTAKRARRKLPEAELAALRRSLGAADDPAWDARRDVVLRRVEITACLNLYHELRGSAHRHGIEKGLEWRHDGARSRLRQEIEALG